MTGAFFSERIRVVLLCLLVAPGQLQAESPIHVYAAASLTNAVEALAEAFFERHGVRVVCSFASSSTLARQIERGAPADVYLSANPLWMDYLDERDLIESDSRVRVVGNTLVAISRDGLSIQVFPRRGFAIQEVFEGRLALADPDHVPAGMYAKEALQRLGWWKALEGRLALTQDVRTALTFVQRGACELGIVYKTDVAIASGVHIVGVIPDFLHSPIIYPAAVVRGRASDRAGDFMRFLRSNEGGSIFEKYGFKGL